MRLIDADVMRKKIRVEIQGTESLVLKHELQKWVDDQPTVLVEQTKIVRCRNCRHYNTACCGDGYGWCERRDFGTNDEWYCADGEVGKYAAD